MFEILLTAVLAFSAFEYDSGCMLALAQKPALKCPYLKEPVTDVPAEPTAPVTVGFASVCETADCAAATIP